MKRVFLITVVFLASFLLDGNVFCMTKGLSDAEKCYLKKLDESHEKAKKECTKDEVLMSNLIFSSSTSSRQVVVLLKNVCDRGLILMEPLFSRTSLTSLIAISKVDKGSIESFLSFPKVRDVLINCPSNYNIKYNTPLFFALSMNRIDIMKLLVKHGALVCLDYLEKQIDFFCDERRKLLLSIYLSLNDLETDNTGHYEKQSENDLKKEKLEIKKTFEVFKNWYKNEFLNKNITSGLLNCLKDGCFCDVKFKFD